jgi:hypothetical protein
LVVNDPLINFNGKNPSRATNERHNLRGESISREIYLSLVHKTFWKLHAHKEIFQGQALFFLDHPVNQTSKEDLLHGIPNSAAKE